MKNWFITGISSGLGKALAESVIEKGDFVIGTYRNQSQVDEFNTKYAGKRPFNTFGCYQRTKY